jgi:catechol 2,3-dioxygenase-like lactoylglutathione lyase family enzyme
MEQRLSVVTIGVADVDRSVAFYGALGWSPEVHQPGEIAFFQLGGVVLSVWRRAALAEDSGCEDRGGWGGIGLAHNVRSADDVDRAVSLAQSAGGSIARRGSDQPWGGYSGVFLDPDGHSWEVAWNPGFPLAADGTVSIG